MTTIPPGCCPVERFTPVILSARRTIRNAGPGFPAEKPLDESLSSGRRSSMVLRGRYDLPKARARNRGRGFIRRKNSGRCRNFFLLMPRNVSNGISTPSRPNRPQSGQSRRQVISGPRRLQCFSKARLQTAYFFFSSLLSLIARNCTSGTQWGEVNP